MRLLVLCLFGHLIFLTQMFAQNSDQTATCTFDDGKEISVQYKTGGGEAPRNGKLWEPGGSPMILFAQTGLTVGGSSIAANAYSIYIIPGKKDWTLIVNRNVKTGSSYDASQDLARTSMETGEIDQPEKELQASFAHLGPKDCNLRLYYGKVGAFAEFNEQ